jgi:ribosome-associated toxin RatA of RatAB toxin-antitoxin module
MKKITYVVLFSLIAFCVQAQEEWQLKKSLDGIKVFYRSTSNTAVKELRIITTIDASLSAIMTLLYDVKRYPEWVYSCTAAKPLEQINETELYYYSVMDFPWPLGDRDLVTYSQFQQDEKTGKIISQSQAASKYIANKKDLVRIEVLKIRWELTPMPDGKVKTEYFLLSDPGGNIPDWAINLALDYGPLQSIQKFKTLLKEQRYQTASLNFVDDFNTGR